MKQILNLAALPLAALLLAAPSLAHADGVTDFIINPASGHTINAPGSYRLAADVTMTNAAVPALLINAADATIDLNGHTIVGGQGVRGLVPAARAVVRNGRVRASTGNGVNLSGPDATVSDVVVQGCSATGILVNNRARVERCTSTGNIAPAEITGSSGGIQTGSDSLVADCIATGNFGGSGAPGEDEGFEGGDGVGIATAGGCIVRNCVASGNGGGAGGPSSVPKTGIGGQGGNGIGISAGANTLVENCVANGNRSSVGGTGETPGAAGVGIGISCGNGAIVRGCRISGNQNGTGILARFFGTVIENNSIDGNSTQVNGIRVTNGAPGVLVRGNRTAGHTGFGIVLEGGANRCESNRHSDGLQDVGGNSIGAGDLANIPY